MPLKYGLTSNEVFQLRQDWKGHLQRWHPKFEGRSYEWRFPWPWGYPNSWMVYVMENPMNILMI